MAGSILSRMDKICLVIFVIAAVQELAVCWPLGYYPLPYYYRNEDYAGESFNQIIKSNPPLPWEISLPLARYDDTPAISSLQSYQHLPHFPALGDSQSVFVPDVQYVPDNLQQHSIRNDIPNVWYYQPSYSNVIPSSNLVFPSATVETSTRSHNNNFTRNPSNGISAVTDQFATRENSNLVSSSDTAKLSTPYSDIGLTRKPTNGNFPRSAELIELNRNYDLPEELDTEYYVPDDWDSNDDLQKELDTNNDLQNTETSSQSSSVVSTRSDSISTLSSLVTLVTAESSTLSGPSSSISYSTTLQIDENLRQFGKDNETEVTNYEKHTTNSINEESIVRNQLPSDSGNETVIKVSSNMATTPYSIEPTTSKNLMIDVVRNKSNSDLDTVSTVSRNDPSSTEALPEVQADEFRQSTLNSNVDETTKVSEKLINHSIIESDRLETTEVVNMTSISENKTDFSTDPSVTEVHSSVDGDEFRLFTFSPNDKMIEVSESVINQTIIESDRLETTEVVRMTSVSGNGTDLSTNPPVTEVPFKIKADDLRQFTSDANDETTQVSEKVTNHTIFEAELPGTTETVSGNDTEFSTSSSTAAVPSSIEADYFNPSTFNASEDQTTQVSEKIINHTIIESDRLETTEFSKMATIFGNETDHTNTEPSITMVPSEVEAADSGLPILNANEEDTTQVSDKTINRMIIESDNLETSEVDVMTTVPDNGRTFSMNFVEVEESIAEPNKTDIVDWPVTTDSIDSRLISVDLKNVTFDVEESSGAGEQTDEPSVSIYVPAQEHNRYESNLEYLWSVDMYQYQPAHVIEFMKSRSSNDLDTGSNINAVDREEFLFGIASKSGSHNLNKSTSRSN
ncbi:uncharacterized protein LOC135843466 [Planococcus citri]|uniref:uncharacterized protein LOC135843466 n=1 Tax=Planococcus citri TaxID=170843 RepID=UPI0031F774E8